MRPALTGWASSSSRRAASASDDEFLLDHIALDAADELRAVGMQRFHLGRARGGLERRLVVEPQFSDAVDLDRGRGYVGTRALAFDVVLHVAAQPGHDQRQRRMDLDPVLHELLVGPAILPREETDRLDHDGRFLLFGLL